MTEPVEVIEADMEVRGPRHALELMDEVDSLVRFCSTAMPDAGRYDRGGKAFWAVCHWLAALDATRPTATDEALVERVARAGRDVIDQAFDHYKARSGRLRSIEGDDGEKCWIVPFDAFEALRAALSAMEQTNVG